MSNGPDEAPVLPDTTADEQERGWGDDDERDEDPDDVRRFLEERPPHHGD
jgi:hypothetical protein